MGIGRAVHETDLVSAGRDVCGWGVVNGDENGQSRGVGSFPPGLMPFERAV